MKEDRAEMKEIMVVLVIEKEGERKKRNKKERQNIKKFLKFTRSLSLRFNHFPPSFCARPIEKSF